MMAGRGARQYRLTGIGAFTALFADGRRRDGRFLQLVYLPAEREVGRAGFAVPKKFVPLAVERNRIRRVLREVVRSERPGVLAYDVVMRVKRNCGSGDAESMAAEARRLLRGLLEEGARS